MEGYILLKIFTTQKFWNGLHSPIGLKILFSGLEMYKKIASPKTDRTKNMSDKNKNLNEFYPEMKTEEVNIHIDEVDEATQFELQTSEIMYNNRPALHRVEKISKKLNSADHRQTESNGTSKGNRDRKIVDCKKRDKNDNVTDGNIGKENADVSEEHNLDINKGIEQHYSSHVSYTREGIVWNVREKHDTRMHVKEHGLVVINDNPEITIMGHDNAVQHKPETKLQEEKPNKNVEKSLAQHENSAVNHDSVVNSSTEKNTRGAQENHANLEKHIKRLTFEERETSMGCQEDRSRIYSEPLVAERHQLQPLLEDMVRKMTKNIIVSFLFSGRSQISKVN